MEFVVVVVVVPVLAGGPGEPDCSVALLADNAVVVVLG